MKRAERALRQEIIERCLEMNANGINQGTSGNISARFEARMLISPSAVPYHETTPEMIASMPLDGDGAWEGPRKPSTEWRFHFSLLLARPDVNAVIHAHPSYCTALAIARKEIPACHYMIAAFGGNNVRCAGYATFGTEALSELAVEALRDRSACLLANHGMIVVGEDLRTAMWRAVELETLARQYYLSLQLDGQVILSDAAIDETIAGFASYGVQEKDGSAPAKKRRVVVTGHGARKRGAS